MSRKTDREELRRLRLWKAEAIEVLDRWNEVADKVPGIPPGEFKSVGVGREIDRLQARVAELEAIPPHPYHLPWVKTDPTVKALILKTDVGWVYVGPEPPVPNDWADEAWQHFQDIGPLDPGDTT